MKTRFSDFEEATEQLTKKKRIGEMFRGKKGIILSGGKRHDE